MRRARGHRPMHELYENTEVTDAPVGEDIGVEDETPELNQLSVSQLWELARRQLAAHPHRRSKR